MSNKEYEPTQQPDESKDTLHMEGTSTVDHEYPYVHTYRPIPEGTLLNQGQVTFNSYEQEREALRLVPPLSHD